MKQIAIITFHRTNNYGAALQSYALQQALSSEYRAEILDYRSPYLESLYLGNNSDIKNKVRIIARRIVYPVKTSQLDRRKIRFAKFYQHFHVLSESVYDKTNIKSANERYDMFISGSDQVWNPHLSRGDWNYFLEFASSTKRYSYAASISMNNTDEENDRIKNDLSQFQSILVREKRSIDFLKSLDINGAVAVCDPVFLMSTDKWEKIFTASEANKPKKYILLYTVANVEYAESFARKLAKERNLTIISIGSNQSVKTIKGVESILDSGPAEFLDYIKNAECVVTSSFHAMAFSIIFNVPFYYELCKDGSNNNERLENIAKIFRLENREIIDDKPITNKDGIDWESVNASLENYRNESMQVLLNALSEERRRQQ